VGQSRTPVSPRFGGQRRARRAFAPWRGSRTLPCRTSGDGRGGRRTAIRSPHRGMRPRRRTAENTTGRPTERQRPVTGCEHRPSGAAIAPESLCRVTTGAASSSHVRREPAPRPLKMQRGTGSRAARRTPLPVGRAHPQERCRLKQGQRGQPGATSRHREPRPCQPRESTRLDGRRTRGTPSAPASPTRLGCCRSPTQDDRRSQPAAPAHSPPPTTPGTPLRSNLTGSANTTGYSGGRAPSGGGR
jgi:hypothetical protein